MNIEESRKLERDKYESIYVDKDQHYRKRNDSRGYGRGNHGKNIRNHKTSHEILENQRKSYIILGNCFEIIEKLMKS